jgi:hypothetical protein
MVKKKKVFFNIIKKRASIQMITSCLEKNSIKKIDFSFKKMKKNSFAKIIGKFSIDLKNKELIIFAF